MTQPTEELIIWANTDVNLPELAGPNKTKPIDDLINKGWDFKQKPAADEFNYILNNIGQWVNWTVTEIGTGTSSNIPDTLVRRDGSGNFSAGTITANLSGNAATASTLQTSRTINGTSFNGSANITTNSWGTARTFELTGAITGSVSVDGSGNISLSTSVSSTNGVAILTGTLASGNTIPLPSGYSESQCKWMASLAGVDTPNDLSNLYVNVSGRVVTIIADEDINSGSFHYIIIGVK